MAAAHLAAGTTPGRKSTMPATGMSTTEPAMSAGRCMSAAALRQKRYTGHQEHEHRNGKKAAHLPTV
jgi:hypothetical protein